MCPNSTDSQSHVEGATTDVTAIFALCPFENKYDFFSVNSVRHCL